MHARPQYSDDRFAVNPHVGQVVNHKNVRRMIFNDQILSSFKHIRETPQCFHHMSLKILAQIKQFRDIFSF